ncbi:MAG: GAF domain-containing protein [Sphingomonas sp.]|nr:MAG: GAF domain-containing protein [Sphingomonas sp.]
MPDLEIVSEAPSATELSSCDREQIQRINSVQSFGFLLALSGDWKISHASANVEDFLGRPVETLRDARLQDVVCSDAVHAIRNRLSVLVGPDGVERGFGIQLQDNGPRYDLAIHRSNELIVIEAEPSAAPTDLNAGAMVRSMVARMKGRADFLAEAARLMQALTGFDRTMIYRFHPDGSGEVIAERARSGLEPFLGLRYPASDIPKQARALLVRNPVRILVEVGAKPSPVVALGRSALDHSAVDPIDLSMSTLRAHSAMHIEFLENMGVGATMTVSLVRDGALWGLISCHHRGPRHVGFEQRTTAELFGEVLSLLIEKRERAEIETYEAHARDLRRQLIAAVVERGAAKRTVRHLAADIAALIPCDGFAIDVDGVVTLSGDTPTVPECETLRRFLDEHAADQIFATAELGRVYPPARDFVDRAAGLLVLPISRLTKDYLLFFRHEAAHAVTWAGRPDKLHVVGPDGPRLSPRKSFAAWREIVRGTSAMWTTAELAAADMMRTTLLEIILQDAGLSATEGRSTTQKQELLIAELNHRVRNILGLIRGLVAQSRMSAQDVDTFASVLGDRIHALARAHDQITAKNWGPGSLAALIATEADAFLDSGATRVSFDGPPTLLLPQAFSTVALVIHELMTNAAKHGALASDTGKVTIVWDHLPTGDLVLRWLEAGGNLVMAPTRRGFGSTIIERSIPHELGGEADLDYAPTGLRARFVLPAALVREGDDTPVVPASARERVSHYRIDGVALLVEDNIIIALEAEQLLIDLGAESVRVASSVEEALRLLDEETLSFALLDINLGTETSWPIARRLRDLGVPFIFASGYGDAIDFPIEHRQVPVATKPYSKASISALLTESSCA